MWICTTLLLSLSPAPQTQLSVIPKPNQILYGDAAFEPSQGLVIRYDERAKESAGQLATVLERRLGFEVPLMEENLKTTAPQEIHLDLLEEAGAPDSYELTIASPRVTIIGADPAGLFYGMQTLLQAMPPEGAVSIQHAKIKDGPRFSWRGLHLDVGRHLFDVEDIKKLLRWMAVHKLNVFHWHLTEDQGWRIEIKQYPKLTTIGAYRDSTPPYGDRKQSDGKRYGGFYTQEEVRSIVALAEELHIMVVPEIDMPGHMAAAIAAYPEIGNTDIPDYNPTVQTMWGVKPYTLAPKEETFEWVANVLEEVCALFPAEYIHVGGDEAPKGQWKASAFAQSVIEREQLKDEDALQAYFLARVSDILKKHKRRMLGWDEIREGGLAEGATVMVWRGWHNAVEAAGQGHDVVMAPTSHTYFDYYQADPKAELAKGSWYECIGGLLPLEKVYSLDPVPQELKGTEGAKHILGTQGQIWTEYVKTWEKAEYLAFPRVAALAEVAWTKPEHKDWDDFQERLKPMLMRYELGGVRFFDPFAKGSEEKSDLESPEGD